MKDSKPVLTKVEKALLTLVRLGLMDSPSESEDGSLELSNEQWDNVYYLSGLHGVKAIAWDGVVALPKSSRPYSDLFFRWGYYVKQYEQRHSFFCSSIVELSTFFTQNTINTVQLKGVGYSTLYPKPEHREGGDIDIYTYSANHSIMSDQEAHSLANTLMMNSYNKLDKDYKHSHFRYKGIMIENHKLFLNTKSYKSAADINPLLESILNPVKVSLPNNTGEISVPSPQFNAVFMAYHALQHYCAGGGLHNLCDWAVLIKHYGNEIPKAVTDVKFLRWTNVLSIISNHYLGTNVPIDDKDMELAESVLCNIFRLSFKNKVPVYRVISLFVKKFKRLFAIIDAQQVFLDVSFWSSLFSSVIVFFKKRLKKLSQ